MADFKVHCGTSTQLFTTDGKVNPKLRIQEGSWYLCTDTSAVFFCASVDGKLTLKRLNGDGVSKDSLLQNLAADPESTEVYSAREINRIILALKTYADLGDARVEGLTEILSANSTNGEVPTAKTTYEAIQTEKLARELADTNILAAATSIRDELQDYATKEYFKENLEAAVGQGAVQNITIDGWEND